MNGAQKALHEWHSQRGWEYWHPSLMMLRLFEELGELAFVVDIAERGFAKRDETKQSLEDEIGDYLYTLGCLCNRESIDMDAALRASKFRDQFVIHNIDSALRQLSVKSGVLARVVGHLFGEKPLKPTETAHGLAECIGDVLNVLEKFASRAGLNMDVAFGKSIQKVQERDKDRFSKEL